jgi:hypothetical protein
MIELMVTCNVNYVVILCTDMVEELAVLIGRALISAGLHRISGNRLVNRMVVQRMCYTDIT